MGVPKGRPRNGGAFGNERAIPEQQLAPKGSTRSGVQSSARRNYCQFELGPTLSEEDAANSTEAQPRRKRRKTAVSARGQATRQQAKTQEQHISTEQCNILQVEDDLQVTRPLLTVEREREKVGDSITVALD
jgi:hypothetical protein